MCVTDCPSKSLELITYDKKAKRFVLKFQVDQCTFCGQCGFSCKQGALVLTNADWELAALSRGALALHFGEPEDVARVLSGDLPVAPGPAPAES
jgi:formate hydrogenlyase subunit 6/NADH:ubiquinone oxidoreductase subunit I